MGLGVGPVTSGFWALIPGVLLVSAGAYALFTRRRRPLRIACLLVLLHVLVSLVLSLQGLGKAGGHTGHAAMRLAVIGMNGVELVGIAAVCVVILRWISRRDLSWALLVIPAALQVSRLVSMPSDVSILLSPRPGWGVVEWFELLGALGSACAIVSLLMVVLRRRWLVPAIAAYAFFAAHYALNIPVLRAMSALDANRQGGCLVVSIVARFYLFAALLAVALRAKKLPNIETPNC